MNLGDVFEFVQANKYWLAAAVPFVIAFIVVKFLN
jgi:hypothetical protein